MYFRSDELSKRGHEELEHLIVSIIKSGVAEKPEDIVRFMRLRSSSVASKSIRSGVPFSECAKCGCGKKVDRALLVKIYKVPMSDELRRFLRKDPELGMRDSLSHLLDIGKLYVGRGWTIKIPAPPK